MGGSKSGVQSVPVRNSQGLTSAKNSIAGKSSESTIPTVVSDRDQRGETENHLDDQLAEPAARRARSISLTAGTGRRSDVRASSLPASRRRAS